MLLNSHTALRSFRELDFDLKEFLEKFRDVCPLDGEPEDTLVEFRWADGSVDVVPTSLLIHGLIRNYFPRLTVGDAVDLIPSSVNGGLYQRELVTLFIERAGLSARFHNLDTPEEDLKFVKGYIKSLKGSVVTLNSGVSLSSMKLTGILSADFVEVRNFADVGVVNVANETRVNGTTDISRLHPRFSVTVDMAIEFDISTLDTLNGVALVDIPNVCAISGYARYTGGSRNSIPPMDVYVEVPLIDLGSSSVSYSYAITHNSTYMSSATEVFPDTSDVGLALLYPKKCRLSSGDYLVIRVLAPDVLENNRIVRVHNTSGNPIHACNAWQFGRDFLSTSTLSVVSSAASLVEGSSSRTGTYGLMTPLNYIDIPAYSSLDFLFCHDIVGGQLCVYMMPMKKL